ncbi:hypothetical protein H4582DRAFT_1978347 [Lactarius indigo]|nr:hypothetical protein H4582DRAFT_1978347 [Lactarius indigo]
MGWTHCRSPVPSPRSCLRCGRSHPQGIFLGALCDIFSEAGEPSSASLSTPPADAPCFPCRPVQIQLTVFDAIATALSDPDLDPLLKLEVVSTQVHLLSTLLRIFPDGGLDDIQPRIQHMFATRAERSVLDHLCSSRRLSQRQASAGEFGP